MNLLECKPTYIYIYIFLYLFFLQSPYLSSNSQKISDQIGQNYKTGGSLPIIVELVESGNYITVCLHICGYLFFSQKPKLDMEITDRLILA